MSTQPEGIWAPYEAYYIEAMLSNTGSAMASLERVSDVIEEVEHDRCGGTLDRIDPHALIAELQNIVLQAAALSRYLWPVRPGHEARAAHLRAALDVAESSPLRDRGLRNEIEHFDEKLDAYLAEGIAAILCLLMSARFRPMTASPRICLRRITPTPVCSRCWASATASSRSQLRSSACMNSSSVSGRPAGSGTQFDNRHVDVRM